MKTEHKSYGIIPVYKNGKDFHILCVKNTKGNYWGLPKGTPEGNETPIETATRELKEETGIENIEISSGKTFEEKYSFEENGLTHNKTNTYYFGFVNEMINKQDNLDGVDEARWIKIDEADQLFTFKNIVDLAKDLHQYLLKFPMTNIYHGLSGETVLFKYYESDSIDHLPKNQLSHVVVIAFHKDKILIVNHIEKPGVYGPVCGSIEKDEDSINAAIRETKEESNMKVLNLKLIGYQECINQTRPTAPIEYQLRYVAIVEPYGPFEGDPDGDVTELLEIDPIDYKKYFDWKEIGEVIMNRALELKNKLI